MRDRPVKLRSRPISNRLDHGMLARFVLSFVTTQRPNVAATSLICGPEPNSFAARHHSVAHGPLRFLFWAPVLWSRARSGFFADGVPSHCVAVSNGDVTSSQCTPLAAPSPCLKRRQLTPHRPFPTLPPSGKRHINQARLGTWKDENRMHFIGLRGFHEDRDFSTTEMIS